MLKQLLFRILINLFELERGLVVHLNVGVHVTDVAVASGPCELCKYANFNHVAEAEAASTWRHMMS